MLIDANVPAQKSDGQLIEFLRRIERDLIVVATKSDKLSGNRLRSALMALAREHGIESILAYSSRTGAGKAELWREIRSRMAE